MDWEEVELRYNSLTPEVRGYYLGLLEAWAWDHPQHREISHHRMPLLLGYDQEVQLSAFLDGYNFQPEDFEAAVSYWDNEAHLWWFQFYIQEGDLWVDIATTENHTGLPEAWDDFLPFDHDRWIQTFQEWKRRVNELR